MERDKKKVKYILEEFHKEELLISEGQAEKFYDFYLLLTQKNKVMNLTAITEFEDVVSKHFLDSALLLRFFDIQENSSVLDLGTGAGFPGIPLKIVRPDLKITLLDSLQKRIRFLDEVISYFSFDGMSALHGRAEELAFKKEHREKYDTCTSRAVANLSTLSEYCLPFVKVGGVFFAYKSEKTDDEVPGARKAIAVLGGELIKQKAYALNNGDFRTLLQIKKIKRAPGKYPRKAGTPSREPIT